jgi:hypothetical protein
MSKRSSGDGRICPSALRWLSQRQNPEPKSIAHGASIDAGCGLA